MLVYGVKKQARAPIDERHFSHNKCVGISEHSETLLVGEKWLLLLLLSVVFQKEGRLLFTIELAELLQANIIAANEAQIDVLLQPLLILIFLIIFSSESEA